MLRYKELTVMLEDRSSTMHCSLLHS